MCVRTIIFEDTDGAHLFENLVARVTCPRVLIFLKFIRFKISTLRLLQGTSSTKIRAPLTEAEDIFDDLYVAEDIAFDRQLSLERICLHGFLRDHWQDIIAICPDFMLRH